MKVREKITEITVSIYIVYILYVVCSVRTTYKYFYIFLVKFLPLTIVLEIVKKIANIFDSYATNETKRNQTNNHFPIYWCIFLLVCKLFYFCFALFCLVLSCFVLFVNQKFTHICGFSA